MTEPRRDSRRFLPRFGVRGLLIVPVVFAAIFAGIAALGPRYNPLRIPPYRNVIDGLTRQCGAQTDWFAGPEFGRFHEAHCILKVATIVAIEPAELTVTDLRTWSVSGEGEINALRHCPFSLRGGHWSLRGDSLSTIGQALARMPPSARSVPAATTVIIGFAVDGIWVTRTYDRASLPPRVVAVLAAAEIKLP